MAGNEKSLVKCDVVDLIHLVNDISLIQTVITSNVCIKACVPDAAIFPWPWERVWKSHTQYLPTVNNKSRNKLQETYDGQV